MKRRAAWPRAIQWLGAIAIVVLALAIVWALFVPLADWLARHDVGSVTGSLHETALDNARGRLLTLGAGLLAAGALIFTARNFVLSREGQVTDRYTKAIEQLGSEKLDMRIGGIYALERVARDSARDHPVVIEVLSAFVREHSREPWPPQPGDDPEAAAPERVTRPDVQAAVTVIGRRNFRHDREPVRLDRAVLAGADLSAAVLTVANLSGADLRNANLSGAVFAGATLTGATLRLADLTGANLGLANLRDANLTGADLRSTNLSNANLSGAVFAGAVFGSSYLGAGSYFRRPGFTQTNLRDANLSGADLADADLQDANLSGADLSGVLVAPDAVLPKGWQRDPRRGSSGRLKRGDASPDSMTAS